MRMPVVLLAWWCFGPMLASAVAQSKPAIPAAILPRPTGPFAVGTVDSLWIDQAREERFTRDPGDRRHLMVQIWYPADRSTSGEVAPYIRDSLEFSSLADLRRVFRVRTNSYDGVPVTATGGPFPVLVYNHGGGWTRFSATFTAEMLASHGYVVVSVDHTGFNKTSRFPDGYVFQPDTLGFPKETKNLRTDALAFWRHLDENVFPVWVADARFVLDQLEGLNRAPGRFAGRLDLDRIGMLGWSIGGATAVQVAKDDPRVRAVIDHDGQLFGDVRDQGISRPVMLFHNGSDPAAEGSEETKAVMRELVAMTQVWDSTFLSKTTAPRYELTLARTNHAHFSDLLLFYPRDTTQMAPERAHEIINAYTLAFFDQYLKNRPSELLNGKSEKYGEVELKIWR
ncbi:MAG TPA: hypothetical protein VFO95_06535 [Gemmatimonadales bacterium]|nr:hypothetical protein [Gemmatimonadales bacterium]